MMNLSGKPKVNQDHKLIPKSNYGVQTMSMGYIIKEDAPTIWRGPMVSNCVNLISTRSWQLLNNC
jgi:ATP-binding protein involved in chromosome partitioning